MQRGIELDSRSIGDEAHAELDVLDARLCVEGRIEATDHREGVAPNRTESGPKRCRLSRGTLMNEVMEQVAKSGDDVSSFGRVVIRPEDGRELVIGVERGADPSKCVSMRKDVRVHEDEHVSACAVRAGVARRGRPWRGSGIDDDDFLGREGGAFDRRHATLEVGGMIRRGNDRAQAHARTLSRGR